MTSLRIAQLAERSGVPATTLRYYEKIGLLVPAGRRPNGYRAYTARDVERLAFITRAKRLDLSLDDLRELVTAWDDRDCGDVQELMAHLVRTRLAQTRERIEELNVLAGQLAAAADQLAGPTRPGRCDDDCLCSTTPRAGDGPIVPLSTADGGCCEPAGDHPAAPPRSHRAPLVRRASADPPDQEIPR